MFDTFPALFTVLALYFVLQRKFTITGLFIVAATLTKFYAIVLLVPLILIVWRKGGLRSAWWFLGTTSLFALLAAIPLFFISNPLSYVTATTPSLAFQYAGLSLWTAVSLIFSGPYLNLISYALVIAGLSFVYFFMFRTKSSYGELTTIVSYFLIPIIILLLFFKFVGENYIVWLVPFSAILAVSNTRILKTHWSISLVALLSSVTDSLLPYYMLPLSPWIGGFLASMLGLVSSERIAPNGTVVQGITFGKLFLSALGLISFVILVLMLLESLRIVKKNEAKELENLRVAARSAVS